MRLNTKLLRPWLFFSIVLFGCFFVFNIQIGALQTELNQHITTHQKAAIMARDLRFLAQERLTMVLAHQSNDTGITLQTLSESYRQTDNLISALHDYLEDADYAATIPGFSGGNDILSAYQFVRKNHAELYRDWLIASDTKNAAEPIRRLQMLNQFELARSALDDLSAFSQITQNIIVGRIQQRIAQTQVYFYIYVGMIMLSVLGFSGYQGNTIALPLRKLSITAHRIAHEQDVRFEADSAIDEIASLSQSLSQMLSSVQQAHAELARQEEKYRIVADYSADWEYWLNPDGNYRYVSPACSSLSGMPAQAFYDNPRLMQQLVHPEDQPDWIKCQNAKQHPQGDNICVFRLLKPDGSLIWIENRFRAVFDGEGNYLGLRGANRDISERKQLELDRANYQKQLESMVAERTQALSAQAHELEMSLKDLESFSYSVSHDLRAPLRAIDGFIEMLLDEHAEQLDAEGKRMFGVVQDNARKMGCLIDDILAFSRAGRLEMDWQPVDMNTLLNEVWSDLAEAHKDEDMRLTASDLPTLECDPRAMRQILHNLLGNAIKFSRGRQPGIIKVKAETEADRIRFSITDNGVGFNPDFANKLFVLFQRLHAMDEFEGTGVGLAIVKRFVQKHGGTVHATATLNGGATFEFTLPTPPAHNLLPAGESELIDALNYR